MPSYPIPFIGPAKYFTQWKRSAIDLVVIHCIECPIERGVARTVCGTFQGPTAQRASFHYAVDPGEVIQSLHDEDIAWHADHWPTNERSIGIEHSGAAALPADEWMTEDGIAMWQLSAALTASLCKRWGIPLVMLSASDLAATAGESRGITTHAAVTAAFKSPGGHTDPGPYWPAQWYLSRVQAFFSGAA